MTRPSGGEQQCGVPESQESGCKSLSEQQFLQNRRTEIENEKKRLTE